MNTHHLLCLLSAIVLVSSECPNGDDVPIKTVSGRYTCARVYHAKEASDPVDGCNGGCTHSGQRSLYKIFSFKAMLESRPLLVTKNKIYSLNCFSVY